MKTENGLFVKIEIIIPEGKAGWIEVSPNNWIDCRWDINGKCLIDDLGSFYDLITD